VVRPYVGRDASHLEALTDLSSSTLERRRASGINSYLPSDPDDRGVSRKRHVSVHPVERLVDLAS
jgi:hypothetical protein